MIKIEVGMHIQEKQYLNFFENYNQRVFHFCSLQSGIVVVGSAVHIRVYGIRPPVISMTMSEISIQF